jgi:hypothetical protein
MRERGSRRLHVGLLSCSLFALLLAAAELRPGAGAPAKVVGRVLLVLVLLLVLMLILMEQQPRSI